MTLEDIEIFIAACEAENLSALARRLGRTQPAVSQHIARLERELGVQLLERRSRGVSPTDAGRLFYEYALEGLDALKLGTLKVNQLREGEVGQLSIATGGTTVRHLMAKAIQQFRRDFPHIELVIHSVNSHRRCLEALRNEQADLAFITMGAPIRGLEQHVALRLPWVLVVPQHDKLAQRESISLPELKKISYISLKDSSTSQSRLENILAEQGIRLHSSTRVDDWDTAILFAGLGLGCAITPSLHANTLAERDRVVAIPIEGLAPAEFGWATRRWKALSPVAKAFIQLFADSVADLPVDV